MTGQILLVDLDSTRRQGLRTVLELRGFKAVSCSNFVQLDAALKESWDAIVCDWAFYQFEGPSLLALLRPSMQPVLIYSALETARIAVDGLQAGARGVYGPAGRNDLLEELERIAGRRPVFDEAENQILVVDDSVTMRNYLTEVLIQGIPACTLHQAEDGRSALRVLGSHRIDLIITDLQMPGMDGQSFVQLLRRNRVLKSKPILVVTSSTLLDIENFVSGDTRSAVLGKPARPEQIIQEVKRLLEMRPLNGLEALSA